MRFKVGDIVYIAPESLLYDKDVDNPGCTPGIVRELRDSIWTVRVEWSNETDNVYRENDLLSEDEFKNPRYYHLRYKIPVAPEIEGMLQQVFDGNWDIQEEKSLKRVVIRFPEIQVGNCSGNSHTVKELYVSFTLDNSLKIHSTILGMRARITNEEMDSCYLHSHLSKSTVFPQNGWSEFCLGATTEIADATCNLRFEYTPQGMERLLYLIDSYVRWENTENCHTTINKIHAKEEEEARLPGSDILRSQMDQFCQLVDPSELPVFYWGGCPMVSVSDPRFIDVVNKHTDVKCYKDSNNRYWEISENKGTSYTEDVGLHPVLKFQGNSVRCFVDHIKKEETPSTLGNVIAPNPHLAVYIQDALNRKLVEEEVKYILKL